MQYYIAKSGWEMYDLSRAYGLGYILNTLSDQITLVRDFGYYYSIEVNTTPNINNIPKLAKLMGDDLSWDDVFSTLKTTQKIDKRNNVKNLLLDKKFISSIMSQYQQIKAPIFIKSKSDKVETLYQSLDVRGTKGLREDVRNKYDEGAQIFVPKEDFVLSVVGHLHFTVWKLIGDKKSKKVVSILLKPTVEGVTIGGMADLKALKDKVESTTRGHVAGVLPTLTNIAIRLAKEIYEIKKGKPIFIPKFSSLVYGVTIGAGPQQKPYGGGIYPLDFLYRLIEGVSSNEIFDIWIEVFNKTNQKGKEDLALCLAEFITHPSLESFERYIKTHLRFSFDSRISLYNDEILSEVMQYVGEKFE